MDVRQIIEAIYRIPYEANQLTTAQVKVIGKLLELGDELVAAFPKREGED